MDSLSWFGAGVLLTLVFPMSLIMAVRTWLRRRTWIHVDGTVTSVKTKRQSNGETQTTVRYQYVDASGQQRSGTDTPWFREPKKNSRIAVVYDPDSPDVSEASSMTWLYFFMIFSFLLLLVGLWMITFGW